jgi:hypothetical protein
MDFGLAIANCGFAGSSCAKVSAAKAMADKTEDKVFFEIATKWRVMSEKALLDAGY